MPPLLTIKTTSTGGRAGCGLFVKDRYKHAKQRVSGSIELPVLIIQSYNLKHLKKLLTIDVMKCIIDLVNESIHLPMEDGVS